MRKARIGWMAALAVTGSASLSAPVPRPAPPPPPVAAPPLPILPDERVDYGRAANWLCRPDKGAANACSLYLDAVSIDAEGNRTDAPYRTAVNPAIDCFYVYPTVSEDRAVFSDMLPDARERSMVQAQFARFGAVCRQFAPVYRQFTMSALREATATGGHLPDATRNYDDVRAAWRWYLANENKGRGVVLIGHSQGAMVLKSLIANEIDGKPEQRLIVSALLAGNPDLTVAKGSDRGGSFRSVPLCRAEGQVGCVVAWSSFADGWAGPRLFGGNASGPGREGACVNPAAIAGGWGRLRAYYRRPQTAPRSDPPFVESVGQMSAECRTDAAGAVLRVRVNEGPMAGIAAGWLGARPLPAAWGYHALDIALVQGNLIELIRQQAARWVAGTR
ncbi:MAG: DUF3089 domain-containing protein [Sphingomonas fennica]